MTVNSLKDLEKILQNKINSSLEKEVTNTVRNTMVRNIEDTVYGAYKPIEYNRRSIDDGLADPSNIGGVLVNGELQVFNATITNPEIHVNGYNGISQNEGEYLTPIIEYGKNYDFNSENGDLGYEQPRPYVENTREELKATKDYITAFKQGLKRQGIDVE